MNLEEHIHHYGYENYQTPMVDEAATVLDEWRPNWRDELDWDRLDLSSAKDCILGQLFGGYTKGLTILFGLELAESRALNRPAPLYAFASTMMEPAWRAQRTRTAAYA